MKTITRQLFCVCSALLLSATMVLAQSADELYNSGKYKAAATAYEQAAQSNAEKYLNAAKSYTALMEWDKAIAMYNLYRDKYSGADKVKTNQIITILKAAEREVFVDNIGATVNSAYDESGPRISPDGKKLYFFSDDRPGGKGKEDVWVSTKNAQGEWQSPVNLGAPVNTNANEAIETTNADGSLMILFGNYDGSFGGGDLFYSSIVNDQWTVPCNLGGGINSEYWEVDASITPDGKTIFFTSYEHRMTGKETDPEWYDIYISHLKNGAWTSPKPLPAPVNVKNGDERAPYITSDGRTLYFSSTSHPGLGGYDLFMSKRVGNGWDNWTTPVNLGKEINTVKNDNFISVPAVGSTLYYSRGTTGEGDGFGGADIYRMILPPELRPEPVVSISGTITNQADSLIRATIYWSDFDTGEKLGYSTSSRESGEYYVTLPFGRRYLITANQKGYLFQTEMLDLREQEEDTAAFSEKIGSELARMRNALNRIESNHTSYENLLASNSANLKSDFENLSNLSKNMNEAQGALNASIRRARINWMEGNSGYKEVRKDIQLTEASEGAKLVLRNIYFDTGSANLRSESEQELDQLFEIMEQSRLVVEIGGHTDDVGSDEINMNLSQARAESVVKYIVDKGINSDRISAKGYGETEPIANNETEEGRQENRRVEVKIISDGMEGTGGLVEQAEIEAEEESTTENLHELYRSAARAGGIPDGAACYDTNNYNTSSSSSSSGTNVNTTTTTRRENTRTRRSTNTIVTDNGDPSLGNGGINFLTHSGGGAHGFTTHSGMGIALYSGKARGERTLWGYFMGGTYGGGIEWIRYKDLSGMLNMPLNLDYGLSLYGTVTSSSTNTGAVTNTNISASLGAPVIVRMRYSMEVGSMKLSPYAAYNYNLMKHVEIDPEVKVENTEVISTIVATPSWMELGTRVRWNFLSAGIGFQFANGNSGMVLRAGFGF